MKKRYAAFFAATLILINAPIIHAKPSWMDTCKIYLAQAMVTAYASIVEMAARDLAMQGDPVAAQVLYDIQRNKPARQLACEAGTEQMSGILNQLVGSLSVSPAVRSAIQAALNSATYKVLHESVRWFF